jgi:hypothetical protein
LAAEKILETDNCPPDTLKVKREWPDRILEDGTPKPPKWYCYTPREGCENYSDLVRYLPKDQKLEWLTRCETLKARIKTWDGDACSPGYHAVTKLRWKKNNKHKYQKYCISNRKSCAVYDAATHGCTECKDSWLMELTIEHENHLGYCRMDDTRIIVQVILLVLAVFLGVYLLFIAPELDFKTRAQIRIREKDE